MTAPPQVILFDYQFAPNGQKIRNWLYATGVPYQQCEQPGLLPRPVLGGLGITWRRIPIISIGKDVFCDNTVTLGALQQVFKEKALKTGKADKGFEDFGYRSFYLSIPLIKGEAVSPDMAKDREPLFPILSRPDYNTLRPNTLGEFKSILDIVENDFLADGGPWIHGSKCEMADIQAMWAIKWALQNLDVASDPGFSKEDFPRVYKWIESFPSHAVPENDVRDKISGEDATKAILQADYAVPEVGIDESDALGISSGTPVSIEANDTAPGTFPQHGKLVGLSKKEIVLELENGIRCHFPRITYVVKKAGE